MDTWSPDNPARVNRPSESVVARADPPVTRMVADDTGCPPVPTTTPVTVPDWANSTTGVIAIVTVGAMAVRQTLERAPIPDSIGCNSFLMITPEMVG